jgi:hypothetical protein
MHPSITQVTLPKGQTLLLNSDKLPVKQGRRYRAVGVMGARKGEPQSACFGAYVLDSDGKEILRRVRWLTDVSGRLTTYTIVFTAPPGAKNVILGYRGNVETPVQSDLELSLPDLSSLAVQEAEGGAEDQSDDEDQLPVFPRESSRVPLLPPLSEEDEDRLERKMVWVFAAPRSGTTWLATQLLAHPETVVWDEPLIGYHLGAIAELFGETKDEQCDREAYFFSPRHKTNWSWALRRLILCRTYSQAQTVTKHVIIKEPNGAAGAPLLMDCLPNAKVILLLRDGRDVIESLVDAHRPGSWNPELSKRPLLTKDSRLETIRKYAGAWNVVMKAMWDAYHGHDPGLRLLVRYHELRKETLRELRRVYQFLNIRIGEDELRQLVSRHDFERLPREERGPGKFTRAATTGGWRTSFSPDEQEAMNSLLGETLRELGYER